MASVIRQTLVVSVFLYMALTLTSWLNIRVVRQNTVINADGSSAQDVAYRKELEGLQRMACEVDRGRGLSQAARRTA